MKNINYEKLLLSERVNNLFNQPIILILFCQAILMAVAIWYFQNTESFTFLLSWFSIGMLATFSMILLIILFRRAEVNSENSKYWSITFLIAVCIDGAIWGSLAINPHLFDSVTNVMLVTIMLLGVVAAALPVMSSFSTFFSVFAMLTLAPLTVRFFYVGETLYSTLGFMYILYFSAQLLSSKNMQNVTLKSLRLGFENFDLVENLKLKNQQAEQAKEDAELANAAKSKFLAAASHDLRQPMHALGLFVSKIFNQQRYPDIHDDIVNIKKSSDALEGLLNALLDISKLDAGILNPEVSSFNIQTVLDNVTVNGESKANKKGLQLRYRKTNKVVKSDILMLQRILNNIVSNAIRYTSTGSVFIGCRQRSRSLRIEVRDSGIGIMKNELGDIFEEFYQSGNPERDRSKGLGLGLAIVERLCSLLDHKIEVRSAPNKGSVFSIEVPLSKDLAAENVESHPDITFTSDIEDLNVLVIDDEALIREGMSSILNDWGCSSLLADSAENAIAQLQQCHFIPDIIISDYRLREHKTGAQAIKQINNFLQKDIPAIIVTGDTAADRLQEAKESGYQLLHKPVSPAKLRSLMSYLHKKT